MDTLQAYRAFLRVAETASFSRTAEELRLQQSHVSRLVAGLEAQLGVQLLRRTTRSVTVTEEGERFRLRLAAILGALDECETEIRHRKAEPVGLIRVACPTTLGRVVIAPIVHAFLERYPKTRVELLMNNNLVNLAGDGVDIAVRVGRISDSDHPSRMLGHVEQRLVASRAYLDRVGPIVEPLDLADKNCLCFASSGGVQVWRFARDGVIRSVGVQGDFIANDAETLMARCIAGFGLTLLPGWLLASDPAAKRLVRAMPDWAGPAMPLHVLCAHRNHRPLKIQAFQTFLETHLKKHLVAAAPVHGATAGLPAASVQLTSNQATSGP